MKTLQQLKQELEDIEVEVSSVGITVTLELLDMVTQLVMNDWKPADEDEEPPQVLTSDVVSYLLHALDTLYGPLAGVVLERAGLTSWDILGDIVYGLIEIGFLKESEGDSRQDFTKGNDTIGHLIFIVDYHCNLQVDCTPPGSKNDEDTSNT
jgi:uncharacterized repeat protein (TIGR04138 family)